MFDLDKKSDPSKHPAFVREQRHVSYLMAGILRSRGLTEEEAEREARARLERPRPKARGNAG